MFNRTKLALTISKSICDSDTCKMAPILQFVRWRKRRWAPKSASKIFFVPEKPIQPPEEWEELKWRYAHYNTTMRAIRRSFKEEIKVQSALASSKKQVDLAARQLAEALDANVKWNEETRIKRDARQRQEEQEQQEATLEAIASVEHQKEVERELARKMVLMEEAEARTFISEEMLEAEIEKALNSRVNYNFAVDLEGNRYVELPDGSTEKRAEEAAEEQRQAS